MLNNELELPKKELSLDGFMHNVGNENVSDETVEAMFWDIYAEGNEEKIKAALEILNHFDPRKKMSVEIADAVINDRSVKE